MNAFDELPGENQGFILVHLASHLNSANPGTVRAEMRFHSKSQSKHTVDRLSP
jgi:hypothetical protein